MKIIEGKLDASSLSFAIVAGRFNSIVVERLVAAAIDCLKRHGASEEKISLTHVPGAFEIPLIAKRLADTTGIDAVICLGAVIKGDTPHFDYVCAQAASGIARAAYDSGKPVIFGVLTTDTMEQALDRSGGKSGNKGWDAAMSAIEMINVMRQL